VHQIICTEENIISLGSDGIRVGLREGLMLNKITCVCPAASQYHIHTAVCLPSHFTSHHITAPHSHSRSKDLNSPCSMDLSAHMGNCVVAVGGPELYTVNLSYSQVFYATHSTYCTSYTVTSPIDSRCLAPHTQVSVTPLPVDAISVRRSSRLYCVGAITGSVREFIPYLP